ncbi:MAG TPA: hypothetical protein VE172_03265 [Stackebrandtia sp.]|jgi:hypothetical protein|uniref:hypothetical protein n=1 Tax=Stackebrandtia sp. TaxID=2023065 RepID=UPI002D6F3483|nr:hypothetical protein [Stackebrandtia sp.]HZE37807.1 hypothetical protein [Stackebrandtia sp.]
MRISKLAQRVAIVGGVSLAAALALGGTANAAEPTNGHQGQCTRAVEAIGTVTELKVVHSHGKTIYEFELGKMGDKWLATSKVPHIGDIDKGDRVDAKGCEATKHKGTILTKSIDKFVHNP